MNFDAVFFKEKMYIYVQNNQGDVVMIINGGLSENINILRFFQF